MTTTTTGSMSVAHADGVPNALRVALLYSGERFPDYAVGAAVACAPRLELTPIEWTDLLERMAVALAPLFVNPS